MSGLSGINGSGYPLPFPIDTVQSKPVTQRATELVTDNSSGLGRQTGADNSVAIVDTMSIADEIALIKQHNPGEAQQLRLAVEEQLGPSDIHALAQEVDGDGGYMAADAGSFGVSLPPAYLSGAADNGYRAADAGTLGLISAVSETAASNEPSPADLFVAEQVDQLRDERAALQEQLDNPPALEPMGTYYYLRNIERQIAELDADISSYEAGQRPLFLHLSNDEGREFHATAAGIDRELLDATIKHEGGNFNNPFGDAWRAIQETANDAGDVLVGGSVDTSVGYAQIQPANAVTIARETFGLELTEEEAREMLSANDEFSTAIAAEFLAQRSELVDEPNRTNRVVFTSYAMSEGLIDKFDSVGWDFTEAQNLVESGAITQDSYDAVRSRYYEAWTNAVHEDAPVVNVPDTSGHIPAPTGPGGSSPDWDGTSVFDGNSNVNNAGVPG